MQQYPTSAIKINLNPSIQSQQEDFDNTFDNIVVSKVPYNVINNKFIALIIDCCPAVLNP